MKALRLDQPHQWNPIDIAEPAPPGPGEATVRVHDVGICGTDYAGYLGKMPFFSYPRIPGHELGVEVLAIGEDVTQVKPGDRCSVEPYINCQKCYSCVRGHTNCCQFHQTLGVHCDGGMRPLFNVPARKLHVSSSLTMEQLALVETLAIGCHAVNRGAPTPDETVLVIGAGPIGLSVIEFARLTGARTLVMDVQASRLENVKKWTGFETVLSTGDGSEYQQVIELTTGRGADVVIDATGHVGSMSRAMEACSFAGRLVYVGITQQDLSFPHAPVLHRRELTILASRNALSADFTRILRLIESGQIDTDRWITHRSNLSSVPDVFEEWLRPESRVIKAMVHVE